MRGTEIDIHFMSGTMQGQANTVVHKKERKNFYVWPD